jgi:hypothetical protein
VQRKAGQMESRGGVEGGEGGGAGDGDGEGQGRGKGRETIGHDLVHVLTRGFYDLQ